MKKIIVLIISIFLFSCSSDNTTNNIDIKYNDDKVVVSEDDFEIIDNLSSSFIRSAKYNSNRKYLILNLSGTNYEYCGVNITIWNNFKNASSFGSYFNTYIKNKFDCR